MFLDKLTILAAPQNVSWEGYKPKQMNAAMYVKLMSDKRKKLLTQLADNTDLYSLPDKIVALNEKSQKVIYLVQFVKKMVFGKRAITQVKVWRDKTETITKGLAERIFFEFLLPQADCIVSDSQQTDYGRSFWELRIFDAFSRGLSVYLIDQNKRTKQRMQSPDEFLELADQWWGDDPKFQAKKIAICHSDFWG